MAQTSVPQRCYQSVVEPFRSVLSLRANSHHLPLRLIGDHGQVDKIVIPLAPVHFVSVLIHDGAHNLFDDCDQLGAARNHASSNPLAPYIAPVFGSVLKQGWAFAIYRVCDGLVNGRHDVHDILLHREMRPLGATFSSGIPASLATACLSCEGFLQQA